MTAARSVPVARRQLTAEPTKLVVTVLAVAAAVALVLLLAGLRRGMGEQVTLYIDRQAPVLVGQEGARNFLSQTSVLPESLAADLEPRDRAQDEAEPGLGDRLQLAGASDCRRSVLQVGSDA